MPEGAAELLDMIRISSVETVEAIVRWRVAMVGRNEAFFVENENRHADSQIDYRHQSMPKSALLSTCIIRVKLIYLSSGME